MQEVAALVCVARFVCGIRNGVNRECHGLLRSASLQKSS
jgi:hypothetical protein